MTNVYSVVAGPPLQTVHLIGKSEQGYSPHLLSYVAVKSSGNVWLRLGGY